MNGPRWCSSATSTAYPSLGAPSSFMLRPSAESRISAARPHLAILPHPKLTVQSVYENTGETEREPWGSLAAASIAPRRVTRSAHSSPLPEPLGAHPVATPPWRGTRKPPAAPPPYPSRAARRGVLHCAHSRFFASPPPGPPTPPRRRPSRRSSLLRKPADARGSLAAPTDSQPPRRTASRPTHAAHARLAPAASHSACPVPS